MYVKNQMYMSMIKVNCVAECVFLNIGHKHFNYTHNLF